MIPRYMYSKVVKENEEYEPELYAVLDYTRDELVRWCTNEKAAKDLTEALNESEDTFQMW